MTAPDTGWRGWVRIVIRPLILCLAVLYFILDALVWSIVHPVAIRLARLFPSEKLAAWVRSLGPYPTLALFLIPLIVFEPVKPLAAYLIGTRHPVEGLLVLVIGELLKIITVERLFHMSRDKLMSIRAFAVVYGFVMRWLDYLKSLPPWQAVRRQVERISALVRRLRGDLFNR
jgi:hypothetical protein